MAKAREILQSRLTARGVTLSAALCAVAIAPAAMSAMVPAALTHATFDAALAFAGGNTAGSVSSQILGVAEGVMKSMFLAKLKLGAALLLAICLTLGAAGGLVAQSGIGNDAPKKPVAQNPAPPPKNEKAAEIPDGGETVLVGTVVDETKKPVAGATVTLIDHGGNPPAKSGADGSFRLPIRGPASESVQFAFLAEGSKGELGFNYSYRKERKPVQIVLKASKEVTVNVIDDGGRPIGGADVFVLGGDWMVARGQTDVLGRWTARVPTDAVTFQFWSIVALKNKVGFDYAVQKGGPRGDEPEPLPREIPLKLDGARTLRVKALDAEGKSVTGVKVGPLRIHKPDREVYVKLSGVPELLRTTGEDGAVFDWLPERFVDSIPMIIRSNEFYVADHWTYLREETPTAELSISVLPLERLSGRVTHADGRPAAGVKVHAEGTGAGRQGFFGNAETDADGRYLFEKVYCDQSVIVTIAGKEWAAPYRSGIIVRKGKPVEGVDFVLCPSTRLHGRVTVAKDDLPAEKETVFAIINLGEIPAELRKKGDRTYRSLRATWHAVTDKDGQFELYLGPGTYQVSGPVQSEFVKITIPAVNPPKEIVQNFQVERSRIGPFAARVVDDKGRPVAGAEVTGAYLANSARGWVPKLTTGDDGQFKFDRSLVAMVLRARSADGLRAGIARIGADNATAELVVVPVGKATGRLVDLKGDPIAKRRLQYGIRLTWEPDHSTQMTPFARTTITDEQGRFELVDLSIGEAHDIDFHYDLSGLGRFKIIKTFALKDTLSHDLGDLRIDPEPPKPYVPPTPAEQTSKAFAGPKSATPTDRLEKLLTEARCEYTRPLLLFGQPKDPACIELFRLFSERSDDSDDPEEDDKAKRSAPTPRDLRWEFELTGFDSALPDVRKLAEALGVEVGKDRAPVLAVLDADGKLAATRSFVLGPKRKLDEDALASFLAKHKFPQRDAEKMLAGALAKAKAEDKRVFFITSASWCGPCRLLGRFLEPWKGELNHHYVFVKLDVSRDEHAEDVRKRIQGDQDGGVPWYAILDADGKTLITSNTPDRKRQGKAANIGFPSEETEIGHFMKMLSETAPRLAEGQRAEIRQAFVGKK